MWREPETVEREQRGFLLAAGDRNAELGFAGEAQRGLREALQQLLNRRLVQRLAVDGDVAMACAIATVGVVAAAVVVVVAAGIDCRMVIVIIIVGCQALQCHAAVTADGGKAAVGMDRFGPTLPGTQCARGARSRQSQPKR